MTTEWTKTNGSTKKQVCLLNYFGPAFFTITCVNHPGAPFGKLPTLEIDGKTLHQSVSICRYLAQKHQLIGKSDWDKTECDMIADTVNDMRTGNSERNNKKIMKIKTNFS